MLHDPHKIPEPILVASGLTYIIPCYLAFQNNRTYDASTYLFLTFTTVGFHGTRNEIFALDCIAILNFLARHLYLFKKVSYTAQAIYVASVIYSLTTYFVGQQYKTMSFDPDWNIQMFYHSLMHLTTSYSSYVFMYELTNPLEITLNSIKLRKRDRCE